MDLMGCAASFEGGAIYSYAVTASLTGNNTFEYNSATTGGGIHIHACWSKMSITNSCTFKHNVAVFGGGIYAARSALNFSGTSSITENHAARDGGGMAV